MNGNPCVDSGREYLKAGVLQKLCGPWGSGWKSRVFALLQGLREASDDQAVTLETKWKDPKER